MILAGRPAGAGTLRAGAAPQTRMLNTRGVSSFNDYNSTTNNTRILVRKTCFLLYFIHGPLVFSILGLKACEIRGAKGAAAAAVQSTTVAFLRGAARIVGTLVCLPRRAHLVPYATRDGRWK